MKQRITFVVNPISGTRSKASLPKAIEKYIDGERYATRVLYTEYAGHATVIASQSASEGDFICVAVGGDGTVNEVASGLIGTETALGIVPLGSGNGLARHLCLPMSQKGALSIINQGHTDTFDYGMINGRPFFCTCGMGFDAFVSKKFSEAGRRGLATYARTVLREGLTYEPDTYNINIEDENGTVSECKAFLVACANASQYGNNTYIAPGASMQDGLLDIIIIDPLNTVEAPVVLMELFTKTLRSNRHVRHLLARRLHIHRTKEGAVHFDGDPAVMGTDIEVSVCPRGLRAVVNPKAIEDKSQPNSVVRRLVHPLGKV